MRIRVARETCAMALASASVGLALVVSACLGTESPNPPGRPNPPGGPIGSPACAVDADCVPACDGYLSQATTPGGGRVFVGARCELVSFAGAGGPAPSCECLTSPTSYVLLTSSNPLACLEFGRARTCLYARDEFPGCDLADPASCDAPCAELEARSAADAARVVTGEVRAAICDAPSACGCVLRLEDACYADWSVQRYDCALSDAEILQMNRDAQAAATTFPPCSTVDMSSGTGTCIDDTVGPAVCSYPRDPSEWQGMLVDVCHRQICVESANCGFGLACGSDGFCGPCTEDGQCVAGEACVLDHCLLAPNVECRHRADCSGDSVCIISDWSGSPRADESVRAYCLDPSGPGRPMI